MNAWLGRAEEGADTPAAPLLLEGVAVVDVVHGKILPSRDVLLEAGTITHIEAAPAWLRGVDAARFDGSGLYLSPGLVDAHVHLAGFMLDVLPLFTAAGVTDVVNLSGSSGHLTLAARLLDSPAPVPSLATTGPFIQRGEGLDGEAACAIARTQAASGFRALKFYQEDMSGPSFRRFLECAERLGLPVFGHLVDGGDLAWLLDTPFVIAHAEELLGTRWHGRDEWLRDPEQRGEAARALALSGVTLIPNLGLYAGFIDMLDEDRYRRMLAAPEMAFMPPIILDLYGPGNPYRNQQHPGSAPKARAERMRVHLQELMAFTRAFADAGGRLMLGSDAPNPMAIYGVSLHQEIEALRDAGLSNLRILQAATLVPGELLDGVTRGPIRVGRRANLLLTRADPLDDLATLRKPVAVILRGRLHTPEGLRHSVSGSTE